MDSKQLEPRLWDDGISLKRGQPLTDHSTASSRTGVRSYEVSPLTDYSTASSRTRGALVRGQPSGRLFHGIIAHGGALVRGVRSYEVSPLTDYSATSSRRGFYMDVNVRAMQAQLPSALVRDQPSDRLFRDIIAQGLLHGCKCKSHAGAIAECARTRSALWPITPSSSLNVFIGNP